MENRKFLVGEETEFGYLLLEHPLYRDEGLYKESLTDLIELSRKSSFLRPKSEKWVRPEDNQFKPDWLETGTPADDLYKREVGTRTPNAGRLYIDQFHPEYSTPEVTNPRDLVRYEKAGELIVVNLVGELEQKNKIKIFIHKNNSDGKGNSYGCHINHLIDRKSFNILTGKDKSQGTSLPNIWMTYLVTSLPYIGAGKVGAEYEAPPCDYQISQRADFFKCKFNIDTFRDRALINLRDEPHADEEKYGRFHVIFNDSNMSEWQIYLKVGSQMLFVTLLQDADLQLLDRLPVLKHPLACLPDISRDLSLQKKFLCTDGVERSALKIQEIYLEEMERYYYAHFYATWVDQFLKDFREVIEALKADPDTLKDRLDWIAKKNIIEDYKKSRGGSIDLNKAKEIDLSYHDLRAGIYNHYVKRGEIKRLLSDEEILSAVLNPPTDTRAYFRGFLAKNYPHFLKDIDWNLIHVQLRVGNETYSPCFRNLHPWDLNQDLVRAYLGENDSHEIFSSKLLALFLSKGEVVSGLGSSIFFSERKLLKSRAFDINSFRFRAEVDEEGED